MISSLIRIGAFVPEDGANKVSIGGFLAACLRCSPHPQTLFSFFAVDGVSCEYPATKFPIKCGYLSEKRSGLWNYEVGGAFVPDPRLMRT
ncbi:hypothetical protein MTP99_013265 [Tenebrio molitor]|nr:hypothetical protein MTP99_013265 [Tenebrio molitor]CAH1371793.1 unnamed protein product [Tenebrio molitor]